MSRTDANEPPFTYDWVAQSCEEVTRAIAARAAQRFQECPTDANREALEAACALLEQWTKDRWRRTR
jgi:hypothetical protein